MSRTVSCLPTLEACMVASILMKINPQGRDNRSVPVQRSLGPVSEAHSVFSKNLACTSEGPPKAKTGGCLF